MPPVLLCNSAALRRNPAVFSADLLAEHCSTTLIRSVGVENVLGDIQTDCDDL
jgi:hypothetical protein